MTSPRRQQAAHPRPRATSPEDRVLPERSASLWWLVAGPATWALHFLACYATAAIWCAKHARRPPSVDLRLALWLYTGVALLSIGWFGWRALRHHRWGAEPLPHDAASAGDRHRFLGFAGLLLCGLGFIAVVYTAMAIAFVGSCR